MAFYIFIIMKRKEFDKKKVLLLAGPEIYFFNSLEYPLPYCTQRETRLRVAEDMSAWAMT